MYIPLGFNASSQCTGSGFCFTYANFSASVDTFSYRNICRSGSFISSSIQPFGYTQFASPSQATVSGIATNTLLADARWNISGSCNNVALNSYTLTYTGIGTGVTVPIYQESTGRVVAANAGASPWTFNNRFNPEGMIGGLTNYTITNNGPISGSLLTNTTKDVPGRVFTLEYSFDSGSQVAFLDSANNPILFNVPKAMFPRIDFVSNTVPQSYETGSARPYSSMFFCPRQRNYELPTSLLLAPSSSCYEYRFRYTGGPTVRTFTYVDSNFVSQSLVLSGSLTTDICLKANSLRMPTLDAGETFVFEYRGAC